MKFAAFMSTPLGRGVRIVAGLAISATGIIIGGAGGWILAAVGVVPIVAGAADLCLFAPLLGGPFRGRDAR